MANNSFEDRTSVITAVTPESYRLLRQKKIDLVGPPSGSEPPIVRLESNRFYQGIFEVSGDSRFFAVSLPVMFAHVAFLSCLNEADARIIFLTPDLKSHFRREATIDSFGNIQLDLVQTIRESPGFFRTGFVTERDVEPGLAELEDELHDAQYDALRVDAPIAKQESRWATVFRKRAAGRNNKYPL